MDFGDTTIITLSFKSVTFSFLEASAATIGFELPLDTFSLSSPSGTLFAVSFLSAAPSKLSKEIKSSKYFFRDSSSEGPLLFCFGIPEMLSLAPC